MRMKKAWAAIAVSLLVAVAFLSGSAARSSAEGASHRITRSVLARAERALKEKLATAIPYNEPASLNSNAGDVTELGSYNWSGFADGTTDQPITSCGQGDGCESFTGVSASWQIQAVHCPSPPFQNEDQISAQWVGIDGLNDTTVEQLGTYGWCFEGQPYYFAWYELYPQATVVAGSSQCLNDNIGCPQPGQTVTASVQATPGRGVNSYRLSLVDQSSPSNNIDTSATCPSSTCYDDSAEMIVERPEYPTGITPLADFTRTGFWNATVSVWGRTMPVGDYSQGVYDLAMVDSSDSYLLDCVDQTSPPGLLLLPTSASGPNPCPPAQPDRQGAFSVTWDDSY